MCNVLISIVDYEEMKKRKRARVPEYGQNVYVLLLVVK